MQNNRDMRTNTYPHSMKYLDNIVEIFLGNIVRLLKYFETYHWYCRNIVTILQYPHRIWRQYFPNIAKNSKCINNMFKKKLYEKLSSDF